jgi:hypothetical protein
MTSPHNTAADPAEIKLLVGMEPGGIEAQERQGQAQMLASTTLPTEARPDDAAFEALGFTFGDPVPGDPLFRQATLPEGWVREGTEHAMHSVIKDERGIARVNVFYKAAFYDRKADMGILNVAYRFETEWVYGDETPEIHPLFTDQELLDILAEARSSLREIEEYPTREKNRPRLESLEAAALEQLKARGGPPVERQGVEW